MHTIKDTTRARESTNAIERLYVTMRHLFNRGFYKPMGVSGESLRNALLLLRPEIYGSIAEEKTELNGLIYVLDDHGTLTLAEATPSRYVQLSQAKVLEGHDAWGPMAVVAGRLILRDLNRMACLDIDLE